MWVPSLAMFVVRGVVTGAGAGLVLRGALSAAAAAAPPDARAEVLAGYCLGAYIGISLPEMAVGLAVQHFAARSIMLFFVVVVALAVIAANRAVVREISRTREVIRQRGR